MNSGRIPAGAEKGCSAGKAALFEMGCTSYCDENECANAGMLLLKQLVRKEVRHGDLKTVADTF